ncbi:uncharacterized protein LOC112189725 isoform X3 [Rosa chinensis]|uniref:uncharacterized protein LOC112189725 isoform X3 n=1 Tax=Rosa chinensis TaxID=74649 RepID=UPI001AD8EECD|nr:uncharacterized protein LOC112189725 isoform X3 [Rosa chinensis]
MERKEDDPVSEVLRDRFSSPPSLSLMPKVCCLYNIRGTDVDYGPVVHAFAIVTLNSAFFYVDKRKVESEQFKPNYTAPPPLFHYGGILMNFRGNWEISRRDLQNPGFLAMVTTDLEYMNNDLDDEYSAPSSRSLLCCRIVAITFKGKTVISIT